jgi:uncharacterized protein YcaQ
VQEHFAHGTVRNYWGGSSHATTQMLDALHYRGLLRVPRREKGIRVYGSHRHESEPLDETARRERMDALVDVAVNIYTPLPGASLSYYVRRLRYAVPQWAGEITEALRRARERFAHARIEGVDWYWPNEENPRRARVPETVRLLAPFDPVVHDRTRFELFWGWLYRFEATRRRRNGNGVTTRSHCSGAIGWGTLAVKNGALTSKLGYVAGQPPRDRAFKRELEGGLERMRSFLARGRISKIALPRVPKKLLADCNRSTAADVFSG